MGIRAVLLDFYGTLAASPDWAFSWEAVIAEAGYDLPDAVRDRWWNDGLDGTEHDEHSRSRDHYVAWQRTRLHGLLAECDVPAHRADELIDQMRSAGAHHRIRVYDEVGAVLDALVARGLHLAVCSNWDWDLHEAIEAAGLAGRFHTVVSSAWVGARKPHPRIYEHTLAQAGIRAEEAVFVGDSWGPDVEGPRAAGIEAVWLRRHDPDPGVSRGPDDGRALAEVPTIADLGGLLDLLGLPDLPDDVDGATPA